MRKQDIFTLLFICFSIVWVYGQNKYDIIFPTTETSRNQICNQFNQSYSKKPKEVGFEVKVVNSSLFIETNDENWFKSLFTKSSDGLAIDVVQKNRYSCELDNIEKKQIIGTLLKPVYFAKIKSSLRKKKDGNYRVLVGRLPSNLLNKELEFNILFLSDRRLCMYYTVYNLQSYPWELLDMGMYLDSLTYKNKQISIKEKEGFILKNKSLKFKIPFEKNKSVYQQEDIKPLYDSLKLTDYYIKAIKINAYSSVEGSLERNLELQKERATSIVNALQTFQKPSIKTEILSSENWVEFLNDITNTKHSKLKTLSKAEIKNKLVGNLSTELEPLLKNHRKAVIELELEKKDKYKTMSENELLNKFNASIASNNIDEALEIQNSIFEKMKKKEISPDFLKKMGIPKQSKFVKIINKNSAYRFLLDVKEALIVYNELLDLNKLVPKNKEVNYNIIAIKLKLWRYKALKINKKDFEKEIKTLSNYGINKTLIARMLVNFHIINAENLMRKRDYVNKDKSVTYINNNYKNFSFSNYDYLSLAQFFSYYGNTSMSVKLLENKAKEIDIDENLLFYYLNLTIINSELTQTENYRTIMLNALNMNPNRFCRLFNPFKKEGGITFQLLENDYLRNTYCENCNN